MKKLQHGRSMIEMLGVLAIIGVLSVGAIAGYQKAMMKYKLNKQAQQLSQILSSMIIHTNKITSKGLPDTNVTNTYIKLGLVSKEMIKDNLNHLYDVFGNSVYVTSPALNSSYFTVLYVNITINNSDLVMGICRNVVNIAKEYHSQIYKMEALSGYQTSNQIDKVYYGDKFCTNNCIRDISISQINEMCSMHSSAKKTELKIWIK